MNWEEYEKEIHTRLSSEFPDAKISHNVRLKGSLSKVDRQVDILVEDYLVGHKIRMVVDCKYFNRKIDVKNVECFIGFLNDVNAHKGLMISKEGYSKGAINRAYSDPTDLELDILNFKDLGKFQAFVAIPYSGGHGVVIPAPFGWIIDARGSADYLATMYQRGLNFDEAAKRNEWMYVNIKSKDREIKDLNSLLKWHKDRVIEKFPDARFGHIDTIKRKDAITTIRILDVKSYPTLEYTGFVEFKDFIFFCVLFTPKEFKHKNIRKLEYVMGKVVPGYVTQEPTNTATNKHLKPK